MSSFRTKTLQLDIPCRGPDRRNVEAYANGMTVVENYGHSEVAAKAGEIKAVGA